MQYVPFRELQGQTLTQVMPSDGNDKIWFVTNTGAVYEMRHEQECCETVFLDDICGDLDDLIGAPILFADEVQNQPPEDSGNEVEATFTWTFYKIGTEKGDVTIRWYGTSNGYYSEEAELFRL